MSSFELELDGGKREKERERAGKGRHTKTMDVPGPRLDEMGKARED